jgi:hypothetical protein
MGCEPFVSVQEGKVSKAEALENIGVAAARDPGFELGWEAGILSAGMRNSNKDGPLRGDPHQANNLAFSDSFVGFRLFAPVFGFCQRSDTRNDTRTKDFELCAHRDLQSATRNDFQDERW